MVRRELKSYRYECDGYGHDGKKCVTAEEVTAFGQATADGIMLHVKAWTEDYRGWICNIPGHRGDRCLD